MESFLHNVDYNKGRIYKKFVLSVFGNCPIEEPLALHWNGIESFSARSQGNSSNWICGVRLAYGMSYLLRI